MTTFSAAQLKTLVEQARYNPAAIQRSVISMLEIDLVDPSNPVTFCLESASVLTATFMAKAEADTRKQYPYSAQTPEDLYAHMSDRDYLNRFAIPSRAQLSMLLPKSEVLNKMVVDPLTGNRKIVIPRNTHFTVAGVVFALQYPIEIRQLSHGGVQIVYDTSVASPLQDLVTNVIEWETRLTSDGEWIFFEFEALQLKVDSRQGSLTSATDYFLSIAFEDQYHYTRVFVESESGAWSEIRTTHSDQIYDPVVPTAVLQVVGQSVTVRIPQIYTGTGVLRRGIRMDVYQTKGAMELDLSSYPLTAFEIKWEAYDSADQTIYTAPLKTLRQAGVFSNKTVSGGADALTFAELRERVITNAIGSPRLPITNIQIETALERSGYEVVKNIDNLTNRVFLATKPMPAPIDEKLITAAAASIETVAMTMAEAILLESVVNNNSSITLTPNTIYQIKNGITRLVPSEQVRAILATPADQRATIVTAGNYLYSPFHYVLDFSNHEFDARAYHLDAPTVETKLFVSENDTTLLQVSTGSYGVFRTQSGYELRVQTSSDAAFQALANEEIYVQLAYTPQGEKDRAYVNGRLAMTTQDKERVYVFDLSTNFNVNANDGLELTKFLMYSSEPRITHAGLVTDFEILYATSAVMPPQWSSGAVDAALGRFLLPARVAGVTHEKLRVRFGHALHTLWSRARSVISSVPYLTHQTNVPQLYEADVYQRDANGAAFSVVAGVLKSTLLHKKGDPVLNGSGQPVYRWKVGDTVLDANGNPKPASERGMTRQVDLMLVEGAYWFATDPTTQKYRQRLTSSVVSWLTQDLEAMSENLLDQTKLYFYPKTTLGSIGVMVRDGITTTVAAGQSFQVTLYVSGIVYGNEELRAQLTATTIRTISEQLRKSTVAISGIVQALRANYGEDVIDVQVQGLGGTQNLPALTVLDEGDRCSIRKRLVAQADDTLFLLEDVTCSFIRHQLGT